MNADNSSVSYRRSSAAPIVFLDFVSGVYSVRLPARARAPSERAGGQRICAKPTLLAGRRLGRGLALGAGLLIAVVRLLALGRLLGRRLRRRRLRGRRGLRRGKRERQAERSRQQSEP